MSWLLLILHSSYNPTNKNQT